MLRIHGPTWAAAATQVIVFSFIFLTVTATEQGSPFLHHRRLEEEGQNALRCVGTWNITARNYSPGWTEIRSALAEAAICVATGNGTTSGVVSVRWEGKIEAEAQFVVPRGVQLRIVGDGWFSSYSNISNNVVEEDETLKADAELEEAIADAAAADSTASGGPEIQPSVISNSNDSSSLFVVQSGGSLYLSKMVLSGAWNVSNGGGAVLCFGGEVAGEDLWFDSIAAGGSGGAIHAYDGSNVTLKGLNLFQGCFSTSGGGAVSIQEDASFLLYDNSQVYFENCSAVGNGGGMELSDSNMIVSNSSKIRFRNCRAERSGGGLYIEGSVVSIGKAASWHFESCSAGEDGGGLYLDEAGMVIDRHVSFVGNSADRWGGAVCVIDSRYSDDNGLRLTGGVDCSGNAAVRSGGCMYVENGDVTIAGDHQEGEGWGASFVGNTAGYDGGVIAVDGGGIWLQGGYASSNSAVERGGVLLVIGESEVVWNEGASWNCTAAAGGSLYMSGSTANLTDLWLEGDHTPSGANIFLAGADVRAVNVTLVAPMDLEATYGLHVDVVSTFLAFGCSFNMWGGDSPIVVSSGSLVMDACDFSSITAPSLVRASRPVTIRNAVLGDDNYRTEGFNGSSFLGVGVHTCDSIPGDLSCSVPEDCMDGVNGMGVLCPSFIEAATGEVFSLAAVDDASSDTVELTAATSAGGGTSSVSDAQVVYHPNVVTHELLLRHTSVAEADDHLDTSGGVLWELRRIDDGSGGAEGGRSPDENGEFAGVSADNFTWTALPYTGFLVSGQEVAIQLVGTPPSPRDPSTPFVVYNGEVGTEFQVVWWVAEPDSALATSVVSIESMFYYCREGFFWDGAECISCAEEMATMPGGEGSLDCSVPGVTLNTLPLAKGYWRADVTRTNVYECLNPSACIGGRGMDVAPFSSSASASASAAAAAAANVEYDESRYCVKGHRGAYCSVCADDYRRLSGGHLCISCATGWSSGIQGMLWVLGAVALLLLITLVVFLVGGVSAVSQLKKKAAGYCSCCHRTNDAIADFDGSASAPVESPRNQTATTFGARLLRAVPLQKLKILVVVWQILTQFSHLADIPYPRSYERFLNIVDIVNFDLSWLLTASCLVGDMDFYQRLLAITLGPLLALAFLGITYATAMHIHLPNAGQASSPARQQAVVRHSSAALLVLFLIFSSVSTTLFSTYACDYVEDLGVSLLRADYSISCDDSDHIFYEVYAGVMILLYPIGIPVLFAVLLINRRDKINPPLLTPQKSSPSLSAAISSSTAETERGSIDIGRICSIDVPRSNNRGGVESAPEFDEAKAEDGRDGTRSTLVGSRSGEGGGERRAGDGRGHAAADTVGGAAMSNDESPRNTTTRRWNAEGVVYLQGFWSSCFPIRPGKRLGRVPSRLLACWRSSCSGPISLTVTHGCTARAASWCSSATFSRLWGRLTYPTKTAVAKKLSVSSLSPSTLPWSLLSSFRATLRWRSCTRTRTSSWTHSGSTTKASDPRNSGMSSEGAAAGCGVRQEAGAGQIGDRGGGNKSTPSPI